MPSNSNRGVVYLKPGSVEVQKIDFPTFRNPVGKTLNHGVFLKVATTNICGSGQHMVRGRTTCPSADNLRLVRRKKRSQFPHPSAWASVGLYSIEGETSRREP